MEKNLFKLSHDRDDELDFMERNIHIPSISPLCYERAYLLKQSNSIKLLAKFVNAAKQLDNYDYLETLDKLFENKWVIDELEQMKEDFINYILFDILKGDSEWLFKSEKINIKYHVPVTGIERIDTQIIQIEIKNFDPIYVRIADDEIYQFYSENYVNYCKDNPERFQARLKAHEEFRESLDLEVCE